MVKARIRVSFESGSDAAFEKEVEFPDLREDGGQELVAQHLFAELEKEARWGDYYVALPEVRQFLRPVEQTFQLSDPRPNTQPRLQFGGGCI